MTNRKKRPNGDGSIYQMSDGRWRAALSLGSRDGRRVRRTRIGATREDARLALAELRREFGQIAPSADRLTLREYMHDWLTHHVDAQREASTAASYRYAWTQYMEGAIGGLLLAKVSSLQIEQAVQTIGAGDRTRQLAFAVLSSAFARAVRLRLIPANPCDVLERPRCRRTPIETFTLAETERILEATSADRLGVAFTLAITLGLRQGELFGLQWSDVDWTAGTLRICRQAREVRGEVAIVDTKTATGNRTVTLTNLAIESLRVRQETALREGLAGCPWICPTRSGDVMHRSNFGARHWRPTLKRLGIRSRGMHHARHTAASLLLGSGVAVHVVSQVLGHSRPSITLDLYSHLMPHQSGSAADAMGKLLG